MEKETRCETRRRSRTEDKKTEEDKGNGIQAADESRANEDEPDVLLFRRCYCCLLLPDGSFCC